MRQLISYFEAREIVLDSIEPLSAERIPLSQALGRVLAEVIVSDDNIPPFDNSAMDGYALRAADVDEAGVVLPCVGEIAAGSVEGTVLQPGTCVAVMTGAPIPLGADAVVPVEKTRRLDSDIQFDVVPNQGDHVRPAGGDVQVGERVLERGTAITPGIVGVLASLGYAEVAVGRRPRVAVVTTGNELVGVGERPGPGQIRDSSASTLAAFVQRAGGTVVGPYRARDELAELRRVLEDALGADVVAVAGGVSVGEYDLVKQVLDELGLELFFWRVRQRPGKPLAFGRIGRIPVFGLPGNPVSSAVCFQEYVLPALAKMQGNRQTIQPLARGILVSEVMKVRGLHTFARGVGRWADGRLLIDPLAKQGSHMASGLAHANGLIHLPEELDAAPAGTEVAFEWL